jgi:hypothetical protein
MTDEFREQVRELRAQGLSWSKVSKAVGRPQRTCQRAAQPSVIPCAHDGCETPRLTSGQYCTVHARQRMAHKPGHGERQLQVMRVMRKLGHATSEELRTATGLDTANLGQIMGRLVQLGLVERPIQGHFTMPRPPEYRPEHPITTIEQERD